jgi:hypothetical protein
MRYRELDRLVEITEVIHSWIHHAADLSFRLSARSVSQPELRYLSSLYCQERRVRNRVSLAAFAPWREILRLGCGFAAVGLL